MGLNADMHSRLNGRECYICKPESYINFITGKIETVDTVINKSFE